MKYDNNFLQDLFQQCHRTIYSKITKLTFDELPLESIEGQITQGSINIDGNSAVRRTCNLTFLTDKTDISDYLWTLYTKFQLFVGLKNEIDSRYPDIIWFNQGIYLITSFSSQLSATSYSITISGKDKMCLLNGEISGSLNASVDFGKIQQEVAKDNDGSPIMQMVKMPLRQIIREAVHQYAGEPFHNIVINNLEQMGLELQEYRYDIPLFLWRKSNSSNYENGTIDGTTKVQFNDIEYAMADLEKQPEFIFDSLTNDFMINGPSSQIQLIGDDSNNTYCLAKIDYGETAGYKEIDLVYPDELIANIGESITSVLDKIKNMLGNFEYFYNLEGQFVFQQKKDYVNTSWSPIMQVSENQVYIDMTQDKYDYRFIDLNFFTSFNNTPNILNLKNDFSVWGSRKSSTTGKDIPIHVRYAIDKKPIAYTSIEVFDSELVDYNEKYGFALKGQESVTYVSDFGSDITAPYSIKGRTLQLNTISPYEVVGVFDEATGTLTLSNASASLEDLTLFLNNVISTFDQTTQTLTLETERIILTCDWREVIYRMALDYKRYGHLDDFELRIIKANPQFFTGRTGYEQYYIDLEGFWRQLYAPEGEEIDGIEYDAQGWNKYIYTNPEVLPFWFDFLDSGELFQFSSPLIGDRNIVKNDNNVKSIYNKQTPLIIFTQSPPENIRPGYRYFTVPNMDEMFAKSTQGKSAKNEIDTLLYNHAYCAESITVQSIPLYHLEPNSMIYIEDEKSNIKGEYLVTRLTVPLIYNGTMSITATRAPQRLI